MTIETIPSEAKTPETRTVGLYPPCEKLTPEKLAKLENLDTLIKDFKCFLYDLFERLGATQKDINSFTEGLKNAQKDRQALISEIYAGVIPQS